MAGFWVPEKPATIPRWGEVEGARKSVNSTYEQFRARPAKELKPTWAEAELNAPSRRPGQKSRGGRTQNGYVTLRGVERS